MLNSFDVNLKNLAEAKERALRSLANELESSRATKQIYRLCDVEALLAEKMAKSYRSGTDICEVAAQHDAMVKTGAGPSISLGIVQMGAQAVGANALIEFSSTPAASSSTTGDVGCCKWR